MITQSPGVHWHHHQLGVGEQRLTKWMSVLMHQTKCFFNMRMDGQTIQVGHTNCKEFWEKNTWNSTGRIWKSLWTFKMLVDVYSLHLRFTHVLVGIGSNGFLSISSWTEIQSCPSGHHPKLPFPASVTKAKAHKKMMFLGCGEAQITWMVRKNMQIMNRLNWFYPSTFTVLVPNSYTNRKDDLHKVISQGA